MSTRHYIVMLCALIATSFVLLSSNPAFTQTQQKEPGDIQFDSGGKKENCRAKHPGKLLAVIVPCIRDAVQDATERMTDEFDEYLKAPAVAFMTLVVTFFGLKMLINEGDLKKEGLMLLFKLAGVFLFMDNFGGFIPHVFGTINDGVDIVTGSLEWSLQNVKCNVGAYQGERPWNFMDCILGELFGFAPGAVVGSALIGMLGAAVQSGQFGGMLFMGGTWVLWFILKLLIRATYTYLMALIVVAFLVVISPLIIPLLILNITFQYFEHWLRALMSCMIQPIVVMAYVTLCFSILDKIMFDDQIGLAKNLTKEDIEKAQNEKAGTNATSTPNDPASAYKKVGYDPKFLGNNASVNRSAPILSAAGNTNWQNELYSFDFRDKRAEKGQKVIVSMMALVIIAYLLNEMLDELIQVMQQILGGGFALGAAAKSNPIEQKLEKMKQGMMKGGSGKGGAEGIKDFVNGLKRGITS